MQILEWMLLSLKHNNDAQWCMFASYIWIEQEPERDVDVDGGWEGRIKVWLKEEKQKEMCASLVVRHTASVKESRQDVETSTTFW